MKKIAVLLTLILSLLALSVTANAESESITVGGASIAPTFSIGSKKVFCMEPKVNHPKTGVIYKTISGSIVNESKVKAILSNMDDYDAVVIQYALWSVIDNSTDYKAKLKVLKGPDAVNDFDACKVANRDVSVSLMFYETAETDAKGKEYQKMITAELTDVPTTTKPEPTTVTSTNTTTTTTKTTPSTTITSTIPPSETITRETIAVVMDVSMEGTRVKNYRKNTYTEKTTEKDVEMKGEKTSPNTGDTNPNTMNLVIAFVALAGCLVATKQISKKKK